MADFKYKVNSGSVFKNQNKESDKHPALTGQANVNGEMYNVAAWVNKDKNGNKYISFSFKPLEDNKPSSDIAPDNQKEAATPPEEDDDLPF